MTPSVGSVGSEPPVQLNPAAPTEQVLHVSLRRLHSSEEQREKPPGTAAALLHFNNGSAPFSASN